MFILTSFDKNENKIHLNNIFDVEMQGKIYIEYNKKIIYQNDLTLDENTPFLWFQPSSKMDSLSELKIIVINKDGILLKSPTIIHTRFMRSTNEEINNMCDYVSSVKKTNIENIIEIGSYAGESTILLHDNFKNSKIFAVDIWENDYDDRDWISNSSNMIFVENSFELLTKDINEIIKIKLSSKHFSTLVADNSIDFIYIDGDHSYEGVNSDILNWKSKVKKGGFIGGHDYNDFNKDTIKKSISENFPSYDVIVFDQSWLIKIDK